MSVASALRERCRRTHPCTSFRTWVRAPGRALSHHSGGSGTQELFHPTLRHGTRHGGYAWVVVSVDAVDCIAGEQRRGGGRGFGKRQGKVTLYGWGPNGSSGGFRGEDERVSNEGR